MSSRDQLVAAVSRIAQTGSMSDQHHGYPPVQYGYMYPAPVMPPMQPMHGELQAIGELCLTTEQQISHLRASSEERMAELRQQLAETKTQLKVRIAETKKDLAKVDIQPLAQDIESLKAQLGDTNARLDGAKDAIIAELSQSFDQWKRTFGEELARFNESIGRSEEERETKLAKLATTQQVRALSDKMDALSQSFAKFQKEMDERLRKCESQPVQPQKTDDAVRKLVESAVKKAMAKSSDDILLEASKVAGETVRTAMSHAIVEIQTLNQAAYVSRALLDGAIAKMADQVRREIYNAILEMTVVGDCVMLSTLIESCPSVAKEVARNGDEQPSVALRHIYQDRIANIPTYRKMGINKEAFAQLFAEISQDEILTTFFELNDAIRKRSPRTPTLPEEEVRLPLDASDEKAFYYINTGKTVRFCESDESRGLDVVRDIQLQKLLIGDMKDATTEEIGRVLKLIDTYNRGLGMVQTNGSMPPSINQMRRAKK